MATNQKNNYERTPVDVPVKNLEVMDILEHTYTFKRATLRKYNGPNGGIHVKGRAIDAGVILEMDNDKVVSLLYEIDNEVQNEKD